MCRLFGLVANVPVDVRFSFYESPVGGFEAQSRWNPDGWGVAWSRGGGWRLYREPGPLFASGSARRVIGERVRGRRIISHVRYSTTGARSVANTHPWVYRGWAFAHNGMVDREPLLGLLDDRYLGLEGETDSEVFFHLVVQEAEAAGDPVEGVRRAVGRIVEEYVYFSSLNFIAGPPGGGLLVLRYAVVDEDYYTLYIKRRPAEGFPLEHLSPVTRQMVEAKLLRGERAVLAASEPLSDERDWELVPNWTLVWISGDLDVEYYPLDY